MASWFESWNGEKDTSGKTGEIQMKCGVYLIVTYQ